jgi:tetratricopeptide (TPR) repeat protein
MGDPLVISVRRVLGVGASAMLLAGGLSAQSLDALMARGRAQLDSAKPEAAINTFELAIKRNDRHVPAYLSLAMAIGAAAPDANALRLPFLARRVRGALERVIELDPSSVEARYGLVQYYLQAPSVFGGSVEKARIHAGAIMRLLPARGHIAQGQIARKLGDTVTYERELRSAMRVAPDSFAAFSHFAGHLASTKRGPEAIALLEGFIATHPDHAIARYSYGRLALRTGLATERAIAAVERIRTLPAPSTPDLNRPTGARVEALLEMLRGGTRGARE